MIVASQNGVYWYTKEQTSEEKMKAQDTEENFTYHAPFGDQANRYSLIREQAKSLADFIISVTPESEEQTTALRRIQEAVFWANASIAINEPNLDG